MNRSFSLNNAAFDLLLRIRAGVPFQKADPFDHNSSLVAQDAQNARVILGYDSYFGTFRINDAAGTVIHHVEGSLFPEDLGKDFERLLTVDGDRLTLGFTSKSAEGFDVTRTLVFRRLR